MRIVSLIASATEIVEALGLIDSLVGRSHECDYPEAVKQLPVCTRPRIPVDGSSAEIDRLVRASLQDAGSVYEVFGDLIERLAPTHILTQTQCKVCAVSLDDVEKELSGRFATQPKVVALEPDSLADIWDDIRRTGEACGIADRADALIHDLQDRVALFATRPRSAERLRVACIEWIEPLMAAGNWTPELIELVNADNLFGEAGEHSPQLGWLELTDADPDAIIVAPCGFDMDRTEREMFWLTDRPEWDKLRAVRDGRVFLADGNQYFNRPGPRVVETAQILAEILHPDRFPPALEGIGWRRL